MDNLVDFLKNNISEDMSLDDMLDVFEEMCKIQIEDDMILFEAGTYSFTGEPLFSLSFVRQFPVPDPDNDEFYQLHFYIYYIPSVENGIYRITKWDDEVDGNIFDYIRKSEVYAYAKSQKHEKIEIFIEET